MIGSFLTRGLVMIFGYAYPAYECYKTVEMNKPEIEQLRFWCQYWILVAVLTVCERVGDAFISWVPMYSEAKLAFFIYLWYPKTKGTTYVYDSFFRPYVAKHENEIDQNLLELRTRAGDLVVLYWQRAAIYGQTRVFEILQYVASQSTPRPRPSQPQSGARTHQAPTAPNCQPSTPRHQSSAPRQTEEPPSPTSSTTSSQHQAEVAEETGPSPASEVIPPATATNGQKANVKSETSKSQATPTEAKTVQSEAAPSSSATTENANPSLKETVVEKRVTRARSRKPGSVSTSQRTGQDVSQV